MKLITRLLARFGLNLALPWWLGYAATAAGALFLAWWIYTSGLAAGRAECAAAALREQTRQIDLTTQTSREADRQAGQLLDKETSTNADLTRLDDQAAQAPGADDACLDVDSVRRIQRIR